jgi:hypothetical protein
MFGEERGYCREGPGETTREQMSAPQADRNVVVRREEANFRKGGPLGLPATKSNLK